VLEHLGGDLNVVMDWSFRAKPADFGELVPLFFTFYEQGDPVAVELMEGELRQVDQFVEWFKARGAARMAVAGGLGLRLFPLFEARYGDFVMLPRHDPLHGALILARQTFGSH
jgi:glucosamine kinase